VDILSMLLGQTALFILIFARISGIFLALPLFSSRSVPGYAKVGLSLMLTYILFPVVYATKATVPTEFLPYIAAAASEVLLGLIFGFAASLIVHAIHMAGHILDIQIGFGIVNIFDPQFGQQVPLLGNFKYMLAMILLLATNGHHVLLTALAASFKLVPVTGVVFPTSLAAFMLDLVAGAFAIAFKITIPVLLALLLTDVAMGILARMMPQMNIFVVGIPGKIIIGMFTLGMAIPFYVAFVEVGFNVMYRDLYRLLALLR
jgi:flagellar biosynthetic protein FliR